MKRFLNEKNIYIIVSIFVLFIFAVLLKYNYIKMAGIIIGIFFSVTNLLVILINNYRYPIKNEWNGTPDIENISWNYSEKETLRNLKKELGKSYIKVKEINGDKFNIVKLVNKKYNDNIQGVFIVTCEDLDDKIYEILERKIKKSVYSNLSSYAVLLVTNKNNSFFQNYLNSFPIYQPINNKYFDDPPRTCLSVIGICLEESKMYVSVLPFKWYKNKTINLIKSIAGNNK